MTEDQRDLFLARMAMTSCTRRFIILLVGTAWMLSHAHAGPSAELLTYLNRQQLGSRVNADAHEYYILMAQADTIEALFAFLRESGTHQDTRRALIALAANGAVDRQRVPYDAMRRVVEQFEARYSATAQEASLLLELAYFAMAQYGSTDSLQFLIDRSEADTWLGKPMPLDLTRVYSDETVAPATPATLATLSLCWDGSPGSLHYRDEYLARNRHSEDPAVQYACRQLESGRFSLSSGRRIQEAAWALKQRGFQLDEDGRFVPLDDAEKPPQASAASSAQSEAPVHEPTQTAPSEETTEDASAPNPRLPLAVGAVLALAAIVWLSLRRRGL